MYQRYYDGYTECELPEISEQTAVTDICTSGNDIRVSGKGDGVFGSLKLDDILLIGILIVMLTDDCDDKLMLIILGFLFVSGLN